jgi:hypothetical protein
MDKNNGRLGGATMNLIYMDLETIPTTDDNLLEIVENKVHQKNEQRTRKWGDEAIERELKRAHERTALDGTTGEIVAVGFAVDNGEAMVAYREPGISEKQMLNEFYKALADIISPGEGRVNKHKQVAWVGHNIIDFDLRFLWQRTVISGATPSLELPLAAKPWEDTVRDTMKLWAGFRGRVGLEKLATALGLQGKTEGVDGSQVFDYWKAGRYLEIAEYCKQDVEITREVYKKIS